MDRHLYLLLTVAATYLASLVLVPPVCALARRLGVFAYPDSVRRFHSVVVPLWGGVAALPGLAARHRVDPPGAAGHAKPMVDLCGALVPAAGLACLFGAMDDRWNFSPRLKLVLQVAGRRCRW